MAPQSKREELLTAWRALAGNLRAEGWSTIRVAHGGPCHLLAGRRFPGNEEALLVGFGSVQMPPLEQLPQGRGFLVSRAVLSGEGANRIWIALSRQCAGSLDLFSMMTEDVVATLDALRGADDERLFHVFLARIRAWQDFMHHGGDGLLTPDAEVGLFGELELMHELISVGLPATVSVEAWQGPLNGIQDFVLGTGAIEVKSTVSPTGFPATVGSLDQLDDSLTQPLFLAGIRLVLTPSGKTLPDQVGQLRNLMHTEPGALNTFRSRLLHAGFLDTASDRYTRRFSRVGQKILHVSGGFPRLIRANVPIEIRKARYEIDLDLISTVDLGLAQVLQQLRVI